MDVPNKFFAHFIYFKTVIWFSKQRCRSWVEAMRLLIMALVFSSMITSCVDAWPMLPPSNFQHCFRKPRTVDSLDEISVSPWSVQAFKRVDLQQESTQDSPVRGCIGSKSSADLNKAFHILDLNYSTLRVPVLTDVIYVSIDLTVLANGYDGELVIMLNLRSSSITAARLSVDIRNVNLLRKHKLLVSTNLELHLNNPQLLRRAIVNVERFEPASLPEQDVTWLEKWAATRHGVHVAGGAASYTLLSVKEHNIPNYLLLNVSHAPVLAKQIGVGVRNDSRTTPTCIPTSNLEKQLSTTSTTTAALLKVMADIPNEVGFMLCRQRAWSMQDVSALAPPPLSSNSSLVRRPRRDFVFLEANVGPQLLWVQLETSANSTYEQEAPVLGVSVAQPTSEKPYNVTLMLLTDMLTRHVHIETNAASVLFLGQNQHLVQLSRTPELQQTAFEKVLSDKFGAYRELVRINMGYSTNHDSNFVRVLLGELAVTAADLALRTFIQCSSSIVLIKLPRSALVDLGLDPHRDIWLGDADATHHEKNSGTSSASRCYFRGDGPDLYRVLEFAGGTCGSRKLRTFQESFEVVISVAVGINQYYTFKKSCDYGLNSGLLNLLPLEDHLQKEQSFAKAAISRRYNYDIALYKDQHFQDRYRYNYPILDPNDVHYFHVAPVEKDVQHGVELIDCFISQDASTPEQSGIPPILHLIQGGCSHSWARIKWFDHDSVDGIGSIAFNRSVGFVLASACRTEAMTSLLSATAAASSRDTSVVQDQLFYLHCRLRPCSFQGIGYATPDPLSQLPFCYATQQQVCSASFLAPSFANVFVRTGPFHLRSRRTQESTSGADLDNEADVMSSQLNRLRNNVNLISNPNDPSNMVGLPLLSVVGIASLAFIMGALLVLILWYMQRSTSLRSLLSGTAPAHTSSNSSDAYLGIHVTAYSPATSSGQTPAASVSSAPTTVAALRRPYTCSECSSNCSHNSSVLTGPLLPPGMAVMADSSTIRVALDDDELRSSNLF